MLAVNCPGTLTEVFPTLTSGLPMADISEDVIPGFIHGIDIPLELSFGCVILEFLFIGKFMFNSLDQLDCGIMYIFWGSSKYSDVCQSEHNL